MNNLKNRSRAIEAQALEDRRMLVAFGTPWPDADSLSISFPADGTSVSGYGNELHTALDAIAQTQQWQEQILRAYQTWSIHADINVALSNDHGLDFGSRGLSVGDPRFGEFRIGAIPQGNTVANAVPFQAAAGTFSGDILLNSNLQFEYHDWQTDGAPENPSPDTFDLFSVALHESGNTLGLEDSSVESAVMFGQYSVPKGILTAEDIQQIQSLYGERSDPYESSDDGQITLATLLATPQGFDAGTDVIRTTGRLFDSSDVDFYRIEPLVGHDEVTIRIRTQGVSLLMSELAIVDASGQVLATSQADSVFANDHKIELSNLQNHSELYLRVGGANGHEVYAAGDYVLEVDYRSLAVQSLDAVQSAYDAGPDALFANFDLEDDELGANDTTPDAVTLTDVDGYVEASRYGIHSSVSDATDVDFWRIPAPAGDQGTLSVSLAGVGVDQPDLDIQILDADGQPVGAQGRLLADGTWKLQVAATNASQELLIRVSVDPSSDVQVGNYVATAEYGIASSELVDFGSGNLTSGIDDLYRWTVRKSKVFRFDLSAFGGEANEGVQIRIIDAYTNEVRLRLSARSGIDRSAMVWLMEGDYVLQVSAAGKAGTTVDSVGYVIAYDGISDDQSHEDDGDYDYESQDDATYGYYGNYYYYYYYYYHDNEPTDPSSPD